MLTPSPSLRVDTPTLLRSFQGPAGPLLLAVCVFFLSQLSLFDPTTPSNHLLLWYCGPFMAQVLLFVPSHRHLPYFACSGLALLGSNLLLIQDPLAAVWVTVMQTLEPWVGLKIVQYVLRCPAGESINVRTTPQRMVLGTIASTAWIHTVAAIGALGLGINHPGQTLNLFGHWAAIATIGAATSLPILNGLSFWTISRPNKTGYAWLALAISVPAMVILFTHVTPPFVMLALLYPIMLGIGGVGFAGLLFWVGVMCWMFLTQGQYLDPVDMGEAGLLMMVATVCLVTGILHIQKMHSAARLQAAADTDPLTGLYNRRGWRARGQSDDPQFVVMLDIDHFKTINDEMGHAGGDQLLVSVAQALDAFRNTHDICARLGGDEFVVSGPSTNRDLNAWTTMLRRQLQHLSPHPVSVSIGWTEHAGDLSLEEALMQADKAMFVSKRMGRNQVNQFDPLLRADPTAIPDAVIRNALFNQELYYVVQPIYDSAAKHRIGHEALIRWRRNEVELQPHQFIDTLLGITREPLVQQAIMHMQTRLALTLGPGSGALSFNWTLEDLADKNYVDRWIENWQAIHGRVPQLVIEISESAGILGDKTPATLRSMQRLREAGYQIALDDFGKDHSNLSRLVGWPVDRLKLDKSLIDGLGRTGSGADIIIQTIRTLCDQLKCSIIAEGVETLEQSFQLNRLGVPVHQGYLWGRPKSVYEAQKNADG